MRVRASFALLTLLPLSVFSIAADGDAACTVLDAGTDQADPTDDVLACETAGWLAGCEDAAAGKVHHALAHTSAVPLSLDPPSASFTEGAGCGTIDDPLFSGTRQDTAFSFDVKGYLETNADTLTVELHDISASDMRADRQTVLGVRVSIEGEYPLGTEENTSVDGTVSTSPLTLDIPVNAVASETNISDGLVFTITNLHDVLPSDLYEVGTGGEIEVIVTIDFDLDGAHAIVWGATEVPSSLTFNGEVRGTVVDAVTREMIVG